MTKSPVIIDLQSLLSNVRVSIRVSWQDVRDASPEFSQEGHRIWTMTLACGHQQRRFRRKDEARVPTIEICSTCSRDQPDPVR